MAARQEFVVYLSSTLADLGPERELALKIIGQIGVVKTSYRADEKGVVAACTGDVRKCNLYIGILAQRYGYMPPAEENNPEQKSITELEYETCRLDGQSEIPRLIFIKDTQAGIPKEHIDALNKSGTHLQMEAFLVRAGKDQTPFPFKNLEEFRAELRIRVSEHADQYHRENATGKTMLGGSETWARQLVPVGIACVPGTDNKEQQAIKQWGSNRFKAFDLAPDDPDYLATLDVGLQQVQIACLLLTPASLTRLVAANGVEKVGTSLAMLHDRVGLAVLICQGVKKVDLPPSWAQAVVIEIEANSLVALTANTLENIYDWLRAEGVPLTVDARLALPYVVLAPTVTEIKNLCELEGEGTAFQKFEDDIRELRKQQFKKIAHAAQLMTQKWPGDFYGNERHDWKCFGPASDKTADALIRESVRKINEAISGSREKRFLKSAKLIPRRYRLDEFLNDRFGSKKNIETILRNGCLFIVDELALLHPSIREAAHTLLAGGNTAIVAISPCDPAHTATDTLLKELSYLSVGNLVSRFRINHDPRCKLALRLR